MPSSYRAASLALCTIVVVVATGFAGRAAAAGAESATTGAPKAAHVVADDLTPEVTALRARDDAAPVTLHARGRNILAFAPAKTAAAHPVTVVYLHGRTGRAERGCPWFRAGARELGWLVCPEGVEREADGSTSWGGDVLRQSPVVRDALGAAEAEGAAKDPAVAVGFSQGSYVAVDLVKARLARFRGLVLLGAEMHPTAKTFADNGVARVAFGAGQRDGAYASLRAEAARLAAEGVEARFFDLGDIGHAYTATDAAVLRDAITWAGGKDR